MINGKLCSDPRWEPISADEGVPYVTCRNTHSLLTGPVSLHVSVNELQGFSPEKTLLFCAILICMSGVIFGTKLMNEPKTEEQKTVKLLVGLIVIGIVAESVGNFFCCKGFYKFTLIPNRIRG